ncbi:MAG: 2,3-bisphosphoglycerate-independent phosphoglycerate mutase [Candidatus Moranbacteria bacterium]|nr:2,3-bisphosphoglycerate-independent phosphoglycerate mutase [Candidatus Moranbacteria bacterium]
MIVPSSFESLKNDKRTYRPVVLAVLDGWGINAEIEGNAIANARTPNYGSLKANYPCIALQASGISVGLAWGEPGNSEVGHLTLGSGIILYQNLPRINLAIQNGTFYSNPALNEAMDQTKKRSTNLHLLGLVSNGGVHSHIDHLFALMEMAASKGLKNIFIHAITDGRDTLPNEGITHIRALQEKIISIGAGKIASIAGRNWAMDRNNNWDRVEKAYRVLTGEGKLRAADPMQVIAAAYQNKVSDEFIEPTVIVDEHDSPVGSIREGDSVIFFNFREDRAREITKALVLENFNGFPRGAHPKNLVFAAMVEYEEGLPVKVAFPPQKITNPLAKILSQKGKNQLHIAETEKYAHVTYFFNGGREEPFPGEDRILVPSPQVNSYEETPEMSAAILTEKLVQAVKSGKYDFILVNYANPDMLGHTGNLPVTIKAVQAVDFCLGKLIKAVLDQNGALVITADHGNAEKMIDPKTGEKETEHSDNPVPCFLVTSDNKKERTETQIMRHQSMVDGMLVDIAPTVLELLGLPLSEDMVGNSLLPVLK